MQLCTDYYTQSLLTHNAIVIVTHLNIGCHVSMWPPARTMNWWPLDHFLKRFPFPVSFRQRGSVVSSMSSTCNYNFWVIFQELGDSLIV